MVEVIYFDIDGTLRDEVNGVSEKTRYTLDQCHRQKIRCVICTGRNLESIQDDVKTLPMDGVISGGGCCVQIVKRMIRMGQERNLSLSLEAKYKIYMDRAASVFYQNDFRQKIDNYSPQIQDGIYGQHKIVFEENISDFWKEMPDIHKICILGQQNAIDAIGIAFRDKVEVIQKRKWNDRWYLELLPKNCNKGNAIIWLNHKLRVRRTDTMCFGDSENDIDMMKAAGIAIAMRSNNILVEQYASSVCEAVAEDGIYRELKGDA